MKGMEVYGRFMAGIRRRFPVVYFSVLPAFVSIIYFLHHRDFGQRFERPRCKAHQQSVMIHAAAFLAGFSVIFYILGFSPARLACCFCNTIT